MGNQRNQVKMASERLGPPQFVVIEGVDGVGKTSLARRLEEERGYQYAYTMPKPFSDIRQAVEDLNDSVTRFFYYLACVGCFQSELRALLLSGTRVVVDRYIYSTLVMHRAMGVAVDAIRPDLLPICMPDAAILLTCGRNERSRRILSRGLERDAYVREKSDLFDRAEAMFLEVEDFHVIDTTDKSIEEVYRDATRFLNERRRKE